MSASRYIEFKSKEGIKRRWLISADYEVHGEYSRATRVDPEENQEIEVGQVYTKRTGAWHRVKNIEPIRDEILNLCWQDIRQEAMNI